jgi:hypothetical protein
MTMKKNMSILAIAICAVFAVGAVGCGPSLNPKTKGELESGLTAKKGEFKQCYEAALETDREAKGEMNLHLDVNAKSKKVNSADVKKSDIADGKMKKCVATAAEGIELSEAPNVDVRGKYTVDFQFK